MRSFFTLVFLALIATSCSNSTESKIKSAVKSIETKQIEASGDRVESISIDSVKYGLASMDEIYLMLGKWGVHGDTTRNVYIVNYYMTAKGKNDSYSGSERKYLSKDNLQEIKVAEAE
jgi:hypothetical protein